MVDEASNVDGVSLSVMDNDGTNAGAAEGIKSHTKAMLLGWDFSRTYS